jgi:hypothetical protein
MVEQYLDGIHLRILAMNGEDGKIYVYRAEGEMFIEAKKIQEQMERIDPTKADYTKLQATYMRLKKATVDQIAANVEMADFPSQLPPIRYRVHFVPLDNWWRDMGIYHADQITITDTAVNEVIAWSRRYMAFSFWLNMRPQKFSIVVGDKSPYLFDDKVLFNFSTNHAGYDVNRNWTIMTRQR